MAELPRRLLAVKAVIYLVFNEGHTASAGRDVQRTDLQEEAIHLAAILHRLVPDDPEVGGLLALLLLQSSRREARTHGGRPVPLPEQDRSRWDHDRIRRGIELVRDGLSRGRAGPYLLQAAVASVHAEAVSYDTTDWRRILAYYDLLAAAMDTPVVHLNRAVARMEAGDPEGAARDVEELAGELGGYHPWHATRGEVLARLGRDAEAVEAFARAIDLCDNQAVAAHLRRRIRTLG